VATRPEGGLSVNPFVAGVVEVDREARVSGPFALEAVSNADEQRLANGPSLLIAFRSAAETFVAMAGLTSSVLPSAKLVAAGTRRLGIRRRAGLVNALAH